MNRRTLLLALGGAAAGASTAPLRALGATPVITPPPPPPDDTYGFSSTLRAEGVGGPVTRDLSSWVKTLKVLGEAPLLTADAAASGPVFRLTMLSARRPAVTLRVTWAEDRRSATAMISTGDGAGVPAQRARTVRRDFTGLEAFNLLGLADSRETFWDAAPLPPAWEAIQALADCPTCPVAEPAGDQMLLEGRIGARRHLLLRAAPGPTTLLARFQAAVLPSDKLAGLPPARKAPPKRKKPKQHAPKKRVRRVAKPTAPKPLVPKPVAPKVAPKPQLR